MRLQELAGHGLETDHERRAGQAPCALQRLLDQRLMTQMQAIESAECRDAAEVALAQVAWTADELHVRCR